MNNIDKNPVDLEVKESLEVLEETGLVKETLSNPANQRKQSADHNEESKYAIKWDQIPTNSIDAFYLSLIHI